MSDDAAAEWLAVAAKELSQYEPKELARRCRMARSECTYHGQIVPFIKQYGMDVW